MVKDEALEVIKRLTAHGELPHGTPGEYTNNPSFRDGVHHDIGDANFKDHKGHRRKKLSDEEIKDIVEANLPVSLRPSEPAESGGDGFVQHMHDITGLSGAALVIAIIIWEGSRVIPVRNLILVS